MAAITDSAHRFRYTIGANHGAANPSGPQLASLESEGPLLVRPTHVLAKVLRRDAAGVNATITSRELERLFGKKLVFAADLLALPVRWVGTARSWSQLVGRTVGTDRPTRQTHLCQKRYLPQPMSNIA